METVRTIAHRLECSEEFAAEIAFIAADKLREQAKVIDILVDALECILAHEKQYIIPPRVQIACDALRKARDLI